MTTIRILKRKRLPPRLCESKRSLESASSREGNKDCRGNIDREARKVGESEWKLNSKLALPKAGHFWVLRLWQARAEQKRILSRVGVCRVLSRDSRTLSFDKAWYTVPFCGLCHVCTLLLPSWRCHTEYLDVLLPLRSFSRGHPFISFVVRSSSCSFYPAKIRLQEVWR